MMLGYLMLFMTVIDGTFPYSKNAFQYTFKLSGISCKSSSLKLF